MLLLFTGVTITLILVGNNQLILATVLLRLSFAVINFCNRALSHF